MVVVGNECNLTECVREAPESSGRRLRLLILWADSDLLCGELQ